MHLRVSTYMNQSSQTVTYVRRQEDKVFKSPRKLYNYARDRSKLVTNFNDYVSTGNDRDNNLLDKEIIETRYSLELNII